MKNKVFWVIGIILAISLIVLFVLMVQPKKYNEITNIQSIKNGLNNDYSNEIVRGYLIFKTKSCSLRTSDPPYPPESPCAPNSGYIILSDDKNAKIPNDPTNSKTILKNNEILVHYVNDYTIDSSKLGDFYEVNGEDVNYNSIPSLQFYGE